MLIRALKARRAIMAKRSFMDAGTGSVFRLLVERPTTGWRPQLVKTSLLGMNSKKYLKVLDSSSLVRESLA